ncbi:MAG: hypothetical protein COW54_11545 [Rhodobacteraceae bacterium CG17_big_fil_post_rev_8_21_14_2_50_63_15]|nr:hypothetical protein [Roseovarius sp.]PIV78016.1 MAG: hypothetical protein COW54_11545 [Rhodobacteraceae bacterium CG17_big_fil_post_rev_8_21_14_2_50_63_15]
MRGLIVIAGMALVLGGCAQVAQVVARKPVQTTPQPPVQITGPQTAATLDSTTQAERQVAVATAQASPARDLGVTIASLGTPAEPGFWLKTPLVRARAKGRVDYAATGKSVAVDLIPLDASAGAGSRLSLAGFRVIGAPLTALPELRVYRLAP